MMLKCSHSWKINWSTVLEIDKHIYHSSEFKGRLKYTAHALRTLFKQRPNLGKEHFSSKFLFFKSMKRPDYDLLFESIVSCCQHPNKAIDLVNINSRIPRIYPLWIILKHLPSLLKLISINPLRSAYLFSRAAHYLEVAERINNTHDYKNLVVFADMQPHDNVLAQIARAQGKKTVTLQHGLYIDYTNYPNINTVNYKNTVCEYFLAWGESTKRLIAHYHPKTEIIVCGKPTIQPFRVPTAANYLTILFDQNLLRSYNSEMLRIAYEIQDKHGLPVNLRLHPRNNPKQYRIRKSTLLNQDIEHSALIIAHTTSLIHEVMRQGKAVYKYKTEIPSIEVPEQVQFETADDLMIKYKSQNTSPNTFSEMATEYILFTDKQSLKAYQGFFNSITS